MVETVFVVAHDGGGEGFSRPLQAFATQELADIFIMGASAGYNYGMKVFEMPVINGLNKQRENIDGTAS